MITRFLACFLLGLTLAGARAAQPAHLVFLISEEGYQTATTLPLFIDQELKPLGYRITIIQSSPTDPHDFVGLIPALRDADLLFVSVRRRSPHRDQLDAIRGFVAAGKPLVGIRTTSHAFSLGPNKSPSDPKLAMWPAFDAEVIGGRFTGDYNIKNVKITSATGAGAHPILRGVAVDKLVGNGGLYKMGPLEKSATLLLSGAIPGKPPEPLAWTNVYGTKRTRIFYTSFGHADDLKNPEVRKLLVNSIAWGLGK
jgi:type 1 glutamine amidotransferase